MMFKFAIQTTIGIIGILLLFYGLIHEDKLIAFDDKIRARIQERMNKMYKCETCGAVFESPDAVSERIGEYGGMPAYRDVCICPQCHCDEFEEARKCEICGEWKSEDEMECDVCYDCMDKHKYDFDYCENLCGDETEAVQINSLYASLLTPRQIDVILRRELKQANEIQPLDCTEFIDSDRSWFADRMIEKEAK